MAKKEKVDNKQQPVSFDSELDALFSTAGAKTIKQQRGPTTKSFASAGPSRLTNAAKKRKATAEVEDKSSSDEDDDDEGEEEGMEDSEDSDDDQDEIDESVEKDGENEDEDEEEQQEIDGALDLNVVRDGDSDEDSDSNENEPQALVHETLLQNGNAKKAKRKSANDDEPQSVRDQRSIFIGNLPISIIQDRPAIKALKRHLIEQSPYPSATHVEVIRFRSIPFAKPTDDYEARHPQEAESKMRKRNRSQAYKEALQKENGTLSAEEKRKTYLTGSQKRKIAFITHNVNEKADSVNAYVTLGKTTEKQTSDLRQQQGVTDKQVDRLTANVLAAMLARSAHNSVFLGRHLRVDLVTSLQPHEVIESGLDKVKTADGGMLGAVSGGGGVDQEGRRRTVFVGNMDFEMREEEVRTFFNELMTAERGDAPLMNVLDFSQCDLLPKPEKSVEQAKASWVQDVRIIRDSATQMGKGFGYVRFLDATCVDEIMAIHESEEAFLTAAKSATSSTAAAQNTSFRRKLKLKGRPLRVSRCKVPKGHVTPSRPGRTTQDRTPRPNGKQQNGHTPSKQRSRSTGAPTPGGTSPFAKKQKHNHTSFESPTRTKNVPNPPPRSNDPLKAAEVARKKADPARQAKRMAKKNSKRTQLKMQGVANEAGGVSGKVSLKPKSGARKMKSSRPATSSAMSSTTTAAAKVRKPKKA